LHSAIVKSVNPGKVKAVDSLGISLTLFISKLLFKGSDINRKQWLGSIILIIGILIISL
jgi:uncharacterized membrane protein